MKKEQYQENANLKGKEHETLEISSTGYGLEADANENKTESKLEQE